VNASQPELSRLREGFYNKVDSVVAPLLNNHKSTLINLEKSLAELSKIEDALLVREERLRVSEIRGIQLIGKIPKSPDKLRIQCQRFNREVLSTTRIWEKKYEQALGSLISRFTKSGKLDEALIVKNELIKFQKEVALRDNQYGLGGVYLEENRTNHALSSNGATAEAEKLPKLLIDGKIKHGRFDGFSWGNYPADFIVTFPKVTEIEEIKFLLWEADPDPDNPRAYLYQLFVQRKKDGEWEMIADYSRKPAKGWQKHTFPPADMKAIKILGIFNSANEGFHVVEVQAF